MADSDNRQEPSTDSLARALGQVIPKARLQNLSAEQNLDSVSAGNLYIRNLQESAKLWVYFHLFEILLRNSISDQLLIIFPSDPWWIDGKVLRTRDQQSIREAREQIFERKGSIELGDVIAELNLGFWTDLLSKSNHERLWKNGLDGAFPGYTGMRRDLYTALERLRKLRNRIAHHEPILNRDLDYDLNSLISIIGYITPSVGSALVEDNNAIWR